MRSYTEINEKQSLPVGSEWAGRWKEKLRAVNKYFIGNKFVDPTHCCFRYTKIICNKEKIVYYIWKQYIYKQYAKEIFDEQTKHCPLYSNELRTLLNSLVNIDHPLLDNTDFSFIQILLFGNTTFKAKENTKITWQLDNWLCSVN